VAGVSTTVIGIRIGLGSVILHGVCLGVAGLLVLGPRLVLGFVSLRVVDRRLSLRGFNSRLLLMGKEIVQTVGCRLWSLAQCLPECTLTLGGPLLFVPIVFLL
jgi:hypothetical protein